MVDTTEAFELFPVFFLLAFGEGIGLLELGDWDADLCVRVEKVFLLVTMDFVIEGARRIKLSSHSIASIQLQSFLKPELPFLDLQLRFTQKAFKLPTLEFQSLIIYLELSILFHVFQLLLL